MCVCVHALFMICLVYFHLLLKEKFFLFLFIVHLFLTFNVGSIAFIPFWLTCEAKVSMYWPSFVLSVRPSVQNFNVGLFSETMNSRNFILGIHMWEPCDKTFPKSSFDWSPVKIKVTGAGWRVKNCQFWSKINCWKS